VKNIFKYRCSICNSVSDPKLMDSNTIHVPQQQYHPDFSGADQFICDTCQVTINEVRAEWSMIDEVDETP
jgi:hypothetical protein